MRAHNGFTGFDNDKKLYISIGVDSHGGHGETHGTLDSDTWTDSATYNGKEIHQRETNQMLSADKFRAIFAVSDDGVKWTVMMSRAKAVRDIYAGARNPRTGEQIFPGWVRGSEDLSDGSGSWAGYFVDKPEPARVDFWRYRVFDDPHWDPKTFDFDRDAAFADRELPHAAAVDADLSAFARGGGKLLMYQGWADPVVPPEDTVRYYEAVESLMGGSRSVNAFALLFMAPGMGHCTGGPGPNRFDSLSVLDAWMTTGKAPQSIVAEHVTKAGAVDRTRPLCPYPQEAVWKGQGSTDDAANFVCSAGDPKSEMK